MKMYMLTLSLLMGLITPVAAQTLDGARYEERSLSLGGGYTNMIDTYLSPQRYGGANVTLMSECFSQTRRPSGRWFDQSLFTLHGDYATPPSGSGLTVGGMADYSYTYYYEIPLSSSLARRLRLFVGPQGQLRKRPPR